MLKKLKQLYFWRNLAIYFTFFSFVGHWLEILVAVFSKYFLNYEIGYGIMNNFTEPYNIYGLGAVVCILIVTALPKKITKNIFLQYLVNVVVCAVVEYVSALIIVWRFGKNIFWDYSHLPFNLHGHVHLLNSLLFGLAATIFVRIIYPFLEKCLKALHPKLVNAIFVFMIIIFLYFSVIYWK
ncbi:MAG: putative ABC transporter permease [Candidatus Nomurabacteria bacterium]|jgi:uncharacterized membrane protein|nr:putative ABC transporter permease [Candidatus Nomurabacteria bacterium]